MFATNNVNFAWLMLVFAGLLEVVWSVSMKASNGFTRHAFTAVTLVAAWVSFWLLGLAMRQLPVGTAYAVWTGVGAVGAAVLGIVVFGEPVSPARIACLALIVCGILGLKFLVGEGAN
jgi:quaternary ammonium compound-resistance protein SugE